VRSKVQLFPGPGSHRRTPKLVYILTTIPHPDVIPERNAGTYILQLNPILATCMTEEFHLSSPNTVSGTTGWITTVLKHPAAFPQRLEQFAVPVAPPCGRTTSSARNLSLRDTLSRSATRNNVRPSEAVIITAAFVANHLVLLTHVEELISVAYLGIFSGGSTNSVEDREQRERGSGGGSPIVRGSGDSCNLVQEISFQFR
jgi:hypothetical protein